MALFNFFIVDENIVHILHSYSRKQIRRSGATNKTKQGLSATVRPGNHLAR